MINTIIFDLDGVVINSEPVHQRLEYELFRELGLNIPSDERNSFVGTSSADMWTTIIEKYSLNKAPQDMLGLGRGRYLELVRNGRVPLVEGVLDIIKLFQANGFKILLASSSSSITIREVLKCFKLEEVFSVCVGGDQVSRSKPSPEIFLKAAQLGGSMPAECLVIEDASNGVLAAREAGMYCIGFQSHYTGDQDLSLANAVVSKLNEINLDLIRRIQNGQLQAERD